MGTNSKIKIWHQNGTSGFTWWHHIKAYHVPAYIKRIMSQSLYASSNRPIKLQSAPRAYPSVIEEKRQVCLFRDVNKTVIYNEFNIMQQKRIQWNNGLQRST